MNQYNKLTEMCFNDCATDFTTRNILTSEVKNRQQLVKFPVDTINIIHLYIVIKN